MATQTLLTVEQFLDLPDTDDRVRELDRGQPLEMAPPSLEHSETITRLLYALVDFVKRSSLDLTVSQGAGFALTPDTMRIPDVFVVEKSRVRAANIIRGGWLQASPDLAVEVVSPNDSAADLDVKIHQYLESGTKTVWVVYPQTRRVMIYGSSGVRAELSEEMALTDPDLLPGFSIPVSDIFPKVDAS
jgi:Uma2 family endonuclease